MLIRILFVISVFSVFTVASWGEGTADLSERLQLELEASDFESALVTAEKLYERRLIEQDFSAAGAAAFTRAFLLSAQNKPLEAAEAYDKCDAHYAYLESFPQSLQCKYKAGTSYSLAGKKGIGIDRLKDTARELEKIDQHLSGFAATVYLSLAGEILPPKFDRLDGAVTERRAAIDYCEKAMTALSSVGQEQSKYYASALVLKGRALEDLKDFKAAVPVYAQVSELYSKLPDATDLMRRQAQARLSIALSEAGLEDKSNVVSVIDTQGNEYHLKPIKKKQVRYPKINRNQKVDGAYVEAVISLHDNGDVSKIEVLESVPDEKFGEAFEKAVSKWSFELPEGVLGSDIQPFEYGMMFYLKRR